MKFIKTIVLAVILIASTTTTFSQETNNQTTTSDSATITLIKVKGVTCSSDLKTISENVEKVKGVNTCTTKKKGATTTFEVNYNALMVSEKEITAAIENTAGCKAPTDRPYKVKK